MRKKRTMLVLFSEIFLQKNNSKICPIIDRRKMYVFFLRTIGRSLPILFIMYSWLLMHTILPTTAASYDKLNIEDNEHAIVTRKHSCTHMQYCSIQRPKLYYFVYTRLWEFPHLEIGVYRNSQYRADGRNMIIEVVPLISLLPKPYVFPHRLNWLPLFGQGLVWLPLFIIHANITKHDTCYKTWTFLKIIHVWK